MMQMSGVGQPPAPVPANARYVIWIEERRGRTSYEVEFHVVRFQNDMASFFDGAGNLVWSSPMSRLLFIQRHEVQPSAPAVPAATDGQAAAPTGGEPPVAAVPDAPGPPTPPPTQPIVG